LLVVGWLFLAAGLPETHDTVIIGGGQAGLAMSYRLRERGREHVVLERRRIGERWRTERWNSLHFQLPNQWLTLPGKPYSGPDPSGFSHHVDVIRFIDEYAEEIKAPIRTGVAVTGLEVDDTNGGYAIETTNGPLNARHIVIATGPFQRPTVPDFAQAIPSFVYQTTTSAYRGPEQLPPGAVLVVGSGNSGCQIADELLRNGRRVLLAVSRHLRAPRRYRGQDVIWWYEKLGRFDVDVDTFPNRRYPPTSIMTGIDGGYDLDPGRLGRAGVRMTGRVLGADGDALFFSDDVDAFLSAADQSHAAFIDAADRLAAAPEMRGEVGPADEPVRLPPFRSEALRTIDLRKESIGTIIWASCFEFNFDWVRLPVLDGRGTPIQQRGVTACPGVYFLGLHWMHTFRSAILAFVGRDAAHIAEHMDRLESR
jgi:putative flavoprotein involved in K+ transport